MFILQSLQVPCYYPTAQAAKEAAQAFAETLPEYAWVLLEGEVGTGKTHWVKGMAKALKIEETISSPSFAICNIYQGKRLLLHLDAYRLEKNSPLEAFIPEERLGEAFLGAIEWPSQLDLSLLELYRENVYHLFFWIEVDGRYGVRLKIDSDGLSREA